MSAIVSTSSHDHRISSTYHALPVFTTSVVVALNLLDAITTMEPAHTILEATESASRLLVKTSMPLLI